MERDAIEKVLTSNVDKRVRVTFDDGVVQTVSIISTDEDGFVHSGPPGDVNGIYWTRFDNVVFVEPVSP